MTETMKDEIETEIVRGLEETTESIEAANEKLDGPEGRLLFGWWMVLGLLPVALTPWLGWKSTAIGVAMIALSGWALTNTNK